MKTTFRKILTYLLRIESRLVLFKYKPRIIAITGSVGKTSTKDAVFAGLSHISYVRKSEKSYNSEIGLPLTVLGLSNGWNNPLMWIKNLAKGFWLFLAPHKYPKWLVLEVGVGHPGDMQKTASWLKTDVVIITAIGATPSHIEFFNSRKQIIEEKSKLIKTLKQGGLLILNADDEDVLEMKHKTKNLVLTYGFNKDANVVGSGENILYDEVVGSAEHDVNEPKGIIFRVDAGGDSLPVVIEGVFGRNHIYAALATMALATGLKLNVLNVINSLKSYDVPPGRMRLLKGAGNCFIIDDTYNSSPLACESALKTLSEIKLGGRRIAVLGDMLELGKHTEESHKNIGKVAKESCDLLVIVGLRAQGIKDGATEAGMKAEDIFEFLDSYKAREFIKTFIQKGDLVLVKGSQSMRMERIVEEILLDKENKEKLLVRQEEEWLKKK